MKSIKIYFSILKDDYGDNPLMEKISIYPFKGCYVLNLKDSEILNFIELDINKLTPYTGKL